MDKKTFSALSRIVITLDGIHSDGFEIPGGISYKDVHQIIGWMKEVEKEIEDVETLGTTARPPLMPV